MRTQRTDKMRSHLTRFRRVSYAAWRDPDSFRVRLFRGRSRKMHVQPTPSSRSSFASLRDNSRDSRTLRSAKEENIEGLPVSFLRDAARQYVLNEYEVHYAEPVAMYANILPPIGFIGTTVGMLVLFISMNLSNQSLQLGALGVALTSTIFALIGLTTLESLKISNYDRLLRCIDASMRGRIDGAPTPGTGKLATET